jgi:glycerate kinase
MSYKSNLNKLAMKYNIPVVVMEKIVNSQFEFIVEKTMELDFSNIKTIRELEEMNNTFNIKYLFNFYPKFQVIRHINNNNNKKKADEISNKSN